MPLQKGTGVVAGLGDGRGRRGRCRGDRGVEEPAGPLVPGRGEPEQEEEPGVGVARERGGGARDDDGGGR